MTSNIQRNDTSMFNHAHAGRIGREAPLTPYQSEQRIALTDPLKFSHIEVNMGEHEKECVRCQNKCESYTLRKKICQEDEWVSTSTSRRRKMRRRPHTPQSVGRHQQQNGPNGTYRLSNRLEESWCAQVGSFLRGHAKARRNYNISLKTSLLRYIHI